MSKRFNRAPHAFMPHLDRYSFACHYSHKKDVLDLGGKDGYGAVMMSLFANHITIADNRGDYLEIGKLNNTFLCDTKMVEVDLEKSFPDRIYDTAVAFEIIEHVKDPETFIENIAKHLKVGGVLGFSVPHMMPHIDHLTLFDEDKIKKMISKYLTLKEFYIQDSYGISKKPMHRYPAITYVGVAEKI